MKYRGKIVLLHFVGQMPLAGIAWQAVHYLVGLRKAGLRGLVRRGSRRQPLRSARQQRRDGLRLQCRLSARGDGTVRPRRPLGLLGRDQRCLSRPVARAGARAVRRGRRADQPLRRDPAARRAYGLPGAHHDRHRPGLRADQIRQGRSRRARLSRRAHAFLHLWRESRRAGLRDAAVRRAVAPDPAAGRYRAVARAAGERAVPSRRSPPGRTRARTSSSRATAMSGRSTSISCGFSTCRGAAGDAASRWRCCRPTRRCGARSRAPAGALPTRGRFRPRWTPTATLSRGSRGEFTVAKDIYVRPNSGWFSDRAVCYLAVRPAGGDDAHRVRPALPGRATACSTTRRTTRRSAAIDAIAADYARHSRAAREIAARIFRRRAGGRRVDGAKPAYKLRHLHLIGANRLDT